MRFRRLNFNKFVINASGTYGPFFRPDYGMKKIEISELFRIIAKMICS